MKNILTLYITLFLISCSSSDEEQMNSNLVEITSFSAKKVRIGDTLVIRGKNLDLVTNFRFKYNDDDETILREPLEKKTDLIKVIIPTLNYENFNLSTIRNGSLINSTPLNLIGTFPLKFNSNDNELEYDDINSIKMINDKIAFVTARSKLYKTIDGGYDWELIKDFGHYIGSSMFFINENLGWVEIYDDWSSILYYTNDGGMTFNKIFENNFAYKSIIQIYFSSPTNGYLLTTKGEIYQTDDNLNFELIYDFPNSNEASGHTEFFHFSMYNNSLLASGQSGVNGDEPTIIIGQNNNFDFSKLDNYVENIQLLNDNEGYLVKSDGLERRLYYSNNFGTLLTLTSSMKIHDFYFTNLSRGIGVSSNANYGNHIIFETYDGGKNWVNKFDFKDFEYSLDIDFYNNTGLITGYRGKIWKHIFE